MQWIQNDLDVGESSAIALAFETENPLLILDDGDARKFARKLGFNMTGTLGVLISAYKNSFIEDIRAAITSLRKIGFRIPSDTEIEKLLQ